MSSATSVIASDWLAAYPPPRSLTLDQEALRIYLHAYYIGGQVEDAKDPPISFTTVAAALLEGADDTSKWFAETARTLGPYKDKVRIGKNITGTVVDGARAQSLPPAEGAVRLSSDKQLLTASSRAVLESAENWAQKVGGTDIGVRHLVASYVINPPAYHREQLQAWGVNEDKWRQAFFSWVASRFTWEHWGDASQRTAPAQSRVAFEQQAVKAKLLVWPGDEAAMKILETAAELHRLRQDSWLAFLTLVHALVQRADDDGAVRTLVSPIWQSVQDAGEKYREARRQYFGANPPSVLTPFDDLSIDPRVLNALETARELAAVGQAGAIGDTKLKVGALHLAGAIASVRVDADKDLMALGVNVGELRKRLFEFAKTRGESVDAWREVLGQEETVLTGRPVDLNSDDPEAVVRIDDKWLSDPLAIRPDVEAFASLLASRDLEPPLSIGLFGPWGAGKTTFLKRLQRAVKRHADETRDHRDESGSYVPNIVHVEFNAWHYAESALVSSLVDATIRQIADYVRNTPQIGPKDWLEVRLTQLESRKRQVAAASDVEVAARSAVNQAQTELTTREQEAADRAVSLGATLKSVWTATTSALASNEAVKESGVLESLGETVKNLDDLQLRVQQLRTRPGRMLADLGWTRSVLFALTVLAVPPIVGLVVRTAFKADSVPQILSSVTAAIAVIGLWARTAAGAVSQVDKVAARVVADYERRISEDKSVKAAKNALDAARTNAQTAAASLQAARLELARAQADAANASLPAQTLQIVGARLDDRSYSKELTTLSLARADLEALSRILRAQRTDTGAANGPLRAVDRVILYIDDLDRCKPEDVVRVLQLVHMLLAFELFVVVVAVDARWVEQALRQSYPWLSTNGAPAAVVGGTRVEHYEYVTPEDYLEKIFQIAFWLEPMTAGRAASYLTSLVRSPVSTEGASAPDPATIKVDVSSVELDYMRALAAYVGSSPRRVKRLVNAYRLIKARLSDTQLKRFVTDVAADAREKPGPYQIVIGLLVIGTGSQSASSAILGELAEWDPKDTYEKVVDAFRQRKASEWTTAAQVIETIMRTQKAADVSELRGWAGQVRRFLLHGTGAEAAPSVAAVRP